MVLLVVLIAGSFIVVVAENDFLLAVIVTIVKFQLPELSRLAHILEAALIVGDPSLPEVVKFIIVLKTDDMLVVGHALLQEDELVLQVLLGLSTLGRGGHVFEHPPGNVDVVLDFVSDGVYDWLLGLHLRCLSLRLLHIAEFVDHVDHLRQQLRLRLLAFV